MVGNWHWDIVDDVDHFSDPYWLELSHYTKISIMTAIAARLVAAGIDGSSEACLNGMQAIWNKIYVMEKETTVEGYVLDQYISVYRMPSEDSYELTQYKTL